MQFVEKLRNPIAQSLGRLNVAVRIAIILLACLVAGGLIFWLCNELVYFYIARSCAEELADAYDLNRGVARAILWAILAVAGPLAGFRRFLMVGWRLLPNLKACGPMSSSR